MSVRYKGEVIADVGNTYTAGDGISIEGDTISNTSRIVSLTLEEYNALSEEEKNREDVYYNVSDVGDAFDGGASGSSAQEVYSTEETRIGTWINGKPLYRKVYETEITGEDTILATDIAGTLNIDSVTKIRGTFTRRLKDGTFLVMDIPSAAQVDASKFYCASMYPMLNTKSELEVYVNSDMLYESTAKVLIIFEYTKTTDPEVTA